MTRSLTLLFGLATALSVLVLLVAMPLVGTSDRAPPPSCFNASGRAVEAYVGPRVESQGLEGDATRSDVVQVALELCRRAPAGRWRLEPVLAVAAVQIANGRAADDGEFNCRAGDLYWCEELCPPAGVPRRAASTTCLDALPDRYGGASGAYSLQRIFAGPGFRIDPGPICRWPDPGDTAAGVVCGASEWIAPAPGPIPPACAPDEAWDGAFKVARGDPAGVAVCDRVDEMAGRLPSLAPGRSRTIGGVRCTNRNSGVTCRSLRTGGGFRLTTRSYRLFGRGAAGPGCGRVEAGNGRSAVIIAAHGTGCAQARNAVRSCLTSAHLEYWTGGFARAPAERHGRRRVFDLRSGDRPEVAFRTPDGLTPECVAAP